LVGSKSGVLRGYRIARAVLTAAQYERQEMLSSTCSKNVAIIHAGAPRKLRAVLRRRGQPDEVPSERTIERILERAGEIRLADQRLAHRYSRYVLSLAIVITGSVWPIQARSIEPISDTGCPRHRSVAGARAPASEGACGMAHNRD
jgi:hypothetical protein